VEGGGSLANGLVGGSVLTAGQLAKRVRGESAEERRVRKAAVREARGVKRALKKQLKMAYTVEGELQKRMACAQDPVQKHVVGKF
jgi:hypothetical protein